jgi:hypothetical protein
MKLIRDGQQICINTVAIFFISFGAHTNILFTNEDPCAYLMVMQSRLPPVIKLATELRMVIIS